MASHSSYLYNLFNIGGILFGIFILVEGQVITMVTQAELIHEEDWQTLIIIDAARYDIFRNICHLEGKLHSVKSNSQHTQYWLQRTFTEKYPWHYITAHPYINTIRHENVWNAVNHFERDKIHQIWLDNWDDKLGTVHPNKVGFAVKEIDYDKAIIHYVQPHGPWIGKHKLGNEWALEDWFQTGMMGDCVVGFTKPDKRELKIAYKDNLRLVLQSIEVFKNCFKGKTIITSDHGEMLGEKGYYLHKERFHPDRENPAWVKKTLQTVPWFEVAW